MHSSEVLVVPRGMAPEALMRATVGASSVLRTSRLETRPEAKGIPAKAKFSLIVQGTPEKGVAAAGRASRASA